MHGHEFHIFTQSNKLVNISAIRGGFKSKKSKYQYSRLIKIVSTFIDRSAEFGDKIILQELELSDLEMAPHDLEIVRSVLEIDAYVLEIVRSFLEIDAFNLENVRFI